MIEADLATVMRWLQVVRFDSIDLDLVVIDAAAGTRLRYGQTLKGVWCWWHARVQITGEAGGDFLLGLLVETSGKSLI